MAGSHDPSDCNYGARDLPDDSAIITLSSRSNPFSIASPPSEKPFFYESLRHPFSFLHLLSVPPFHSLMEPMQNVLCTGDGGAANDILVADASHNPSLVGTLRGGPLRQSRSISGHLRIPSYQENAPSNSSNSEDPPFTLGVAGSSADQLPSDSFPRWARI